MPLLKSLVFTILATALIGMASRAAAELSLIMVDQPGCIYCERWEAEIGPAYPKTAEGQFAPLAHADLRSGPPEGVTYDRRVMFTPTFILVEDGAELARIEGYPGEDFFWPLLTKLLEENTAFSSAPASAPVGN